MKRSINTDQYRKAQEVPSELLVENQILREDLEAAIGRNTELNQQLSEYQYKLDALRSAIEGIFNAEDD